MNQSKDSSEPIVKSLDVDGQCKRAFEAEPDLILEPVLGRRAVTVVPQNVEFPSRGKRFVDTRSIVTYDTGVTEVVVVEFQAKRLKDQIIRDAEYENLAVKAEFEAAGQDLAKMRFVRLILVWLGRGAPPHQGVLNGKYVADVLDLSNTPLRAYLAKVKSKEGLLLSLFTRLSEPAATRTQKRKQKEESLNLILDKASELIPNPDQLEETTRDLWLFAIPRNLGSILRDVMYTRSKNDYQVLDGQKFSTSDIRLRMRDHAVRALLKQKEQTAKEDGKLEGKLEAFFTMVKKGFISQTQAAVEAGVSLLDFEAQYAAYLEGNKS